MQVGQIHGHHNAQETTLQADEMSRLPMVEISCLLWLPFAKSKSICLFCLVHTMLQWVVEKIEVHQIHSAQSGDLLPLFTTALYMYICHENCIHIHLD